MPFPAFFLLSGALGIREGIANRREKNRLLDLEADRLNEIQGLDIGLGAVEASNRFDAAQVEAMGAQFQTAQSLLSSKNPAHVAIGANMLQDLDTAVRGLIQQNETELRADFVRQQDLEIAAAGAGKADNEKRFERELAMNKQLNTELKTYQEAAAQYAKINNLLDNDDQLASIAGLTAFVQSIDNSVVRDGELLKYQGANGLITELVNIVNKAEGRDFDETTKQSIRNAAAAIINSEKSRATAITNSYQDRAVSFGLDPERVLSGVDEGLFTPIAIDRSVQEQREAEADAAEAVQERFTEFNQPSDSVLDKFSDQAIGQGFAVVADKAFQAWKFAGRAIAGRKLHIDPQTGEFWEEDPDGSLRKIEGTPDMKRQAEIIRLRSNTAKLPPDLERRIDEANVRLREAREQ